MESMGVSKIATCFARCKAQPSPLSSTRILSAISSELLAKS